MKLSVPLLLIITTACMNKNARKDAPEPVQDVHSYSRPNQVRVTHVALDLEVQFDRKTLAGTATLTLVRRDPSAPLIVDSKDLSVNAVEASGDGEIFAPARFERGAVDPVLGSPLTVDLPKRASHVRIRYSTSPRAAALQWLEPAQTAGKKSPFLFTQSQAINARSWIPLQDSPGVRVTYEARIRAPKNLLALMSAENVSTAPGTGEFRFRMLQAIPSYLIALAVGDLAFAATGKRSGVYAEPPVLARAAHEFDDTDSMIRAAENLYGPYRWERYDILVLPPSFPFGGMENPRLTFVTPTVIAGDKSLVALVAHELAHSWSGNLVTNASWSDFWLNEGVTVYLEWRIQEAVFGQKRAEMERAIAWEDLVREIAKLPQGDQIMHIDLKGRDPDDGVTAVPYIKGALFLYAMERYFGRAKLDGFLARYFDENAFKSITTAQFQESLQGILLSLNPGLMTGEQIDEWIFKPGLPADGQPPQADVFERVDTETTRWIRGVASLEQLDSAWSTPEWIRFLRTLAPRLDAAKMAQLDAAFHFTQSGNSEILSEWLLLAIQNQYKPADRRLEEFLSSVGRRKYLKPLYEELAKSPEGKARASAIYTKARALYHPITDGTVARILK